MQDKIFSVYKLFFYSFILHITFSVNVQAGSTNDIRASYPLDFGSVLLGSARVSHNSVQWTGLESAIALSASGNYGSFGLTGDVLYAFTDINSNSSNKWVMESPQQATLLYPLGKGNAPSLGYFFAPYQAGIQNENTTYTANLLDQSVITKSIPTQGTGVIDSDNTPTLTLSTTITGGLAREPYPCEDMKQCNYIDVLPGGEVIFTITPQSKDITLKNDSVYAYVRLRVEEVNNDCSSANTSFKKVNMTPISLDVKSYYSILDGYGPDAVQYNCAASETSVLSTFEKFYQIKATNIRDTKAGGYAQYRFYLNGHWDINDTKNTKWPGSNIVYRLRTSSTAATPSKPVAQFTATTGLNSIQLDATLSGTNIKTYQWTVTDSSNTVVARPLGVLPLVTSLSSGTYNISLQVTDNNNVTSLISAVQTVTIKGVTPQANNSLTAAFIANPSTGVAPLKVTLDASGSTGASSYSWQSSDQQTSTGMNTSMTFTTAGTYQITLKTADANGKTVFLTKDIVVSAADITPISKPVANIILTSDVKNPLALTLDASNSRSSTGNTITSYEWFIVNTETRTSEHQVKTEAITPYTLPEKGSYVITLVVTDSKGNKASASDPIAIPALSANFTATPNAGGFPLTVQLDATSSIISDNSKIVSYKWFTSGLNKILDGVTSSVTFINPLDYVITLLVTDDKGRSDTSSQLIKVVNPAPPIADFTATPATASGKETLTINLDASASFDPSGGNIVSYQWCCDANGGKITPTPKTSVTLTDNRGGDYKFSLIVTDNDGNGTGIGSNSQVVEKTITLNKPEVKFCEKPDNGKMMVTYGDKDSLNLDISCSIPKPSSSAPNSQIVGYSWSVLDDKANPVKAFVSPASESPATAVSLRYTPGDYTILAKAVDTYGLFGISGTGKISVTPPAIGDAMGTGVAQNGETRTTSAKFYAGAFANGNVVNQFTVTDNVNLLAAINIDSNHINQQADILVVLWNTTANAWFYKNASGSFVSWDFTLLNLGNAESAVTLNTAVRHVKVWNNSLNTPLPKANYSMFVGYRLLTGDIMFNLYPFTFKVQ